MPLLLSDRAVLESPVPIHTTADAVLLGLDLTSASWRRLRKGVYVHAQRYAKLTPWERYAVRVHAYLRRHPDAVLCLESAALVHGLPSFGETCCIHVYDPAGVSAQASGDVRVHVSETPREVQRIGGILVTSLQDTVIDLAGVMRPADALAVADAALSAVQGGTLILDDLCARSAERSSSRGRARMRWVWANADGRAESPHESVSRAVILWAGYEPPVLQQVFRYDGHLDRCDFFFIRSKTVGEADGWGKYALDSPDEAARKLADEKRREDRLRRHGHPFARWMPADAWQVGPLCAALDSAGVRRVRLARPELLATLRSRPRALKVS
ncbi:hypothetical protein [Microbacterium tumbae]